MLDDVKESSALRVPLDMLNAASPSLLMYTEEAIFVLLLDDIMSYT